MQPVAPVSIPLRTSRLLTFGIAAAHAVAALAVLSTALPGWSAALLLLAIGASFAWIRQVQVPEALVLRGNRQFIKVGAGETAHEMDRSSSMLGALIVLRFRDEGRLRSLVLLPDSFLYAGDMRRFRRWFVWQAGETASDPE